MLLGAVGAAVFGTALALVVVPGLAGSIPVDPLLELAGNDYLLLAVFGAAMVVATALALAVRGVSGLDQAEPPDPEEVQSAKRPGDEFTAAVSGVPPVSLPWVTDGREAIRDRLRENAIGVEMRRRNVARADARRTVDAGEWTDDRVAAAFLSADAEGPNPPVSARIRAALRGESWFQRGATRTAAAIVAAEDDATRATSSPSAKPDASGTDDPAETSVSPDAGTRADGVETGRGPHAGASGVPDGGTPTGGDGSGGDGA